MQGTIRTYDKEVQGRIIERIKTITANIAKAFDDLPLGLQGRVVLYAQ